jgi:hypothetical protein
MEMAEQMIIKYPQYAQTDKDRVDRQETKSLIQENISNPGGRPLATAPFEDDRYFREPDHVTIQKELSKSSNALTDPRKMINNHLLQAQHSQNQFSKTN